MSHLSDVARAVRLVAACVVLGIAAGHTAADIPPPPPPKGKKYVGVDNSVILSKDVKGYVFILEEGQGPGAPRYTYRSITLSDKPTGVPSGGRYRYVSIAAIPEDEAKKYPIEKDLTEALGKRSLKGVHRLSVGGGDLADVTDKRDAIPWTFTITAIDPKKGMTVKKERDGKPYPDGEEKPKTGENNAPPDGDDEQQVREAGNWRWLVAGGAVTLAVCALGLWFVRRKTS
jgi:hypothetical protein